MTHWIGIDFGTTKTCAAVWQGNVVEPIFNNSNRTTSSVVVFDKHVRYIGENIDFDPVNTIFGVKRLLGATSDDIASMKEYYSYRLSKDDHNRLLVEVTYLEEHQSLHPEQLCAMILIKILETARIHFGNPMAIINCVFTVPITFNEFQKQAIKNSAVVAGIASPIVISDALAVALYHGQKIKEDQKHSLIVNIGGGFCGISVASTGSSQVKIWKSFGIPKLGGEDFTRYLCNHFARKHNVSNSPSDKKELRDICDEIKRKLSFAQTNTFSSYQLKKKFVITREEYENVCKDLFDLVDAAINQAFQYCKDEKIDIREVLLLGGTTRIPKIQTIIVEKFGKEVNINKSMTEETVGYGAALYGHMFNNGKNISDLTSSEEANNSINTHQNTEADIKEWAETEKCFQDEDERQKTRMRERIEFEKVVLNRKKKLDEKYDIIDELVLKLCDDNIDWLSDNIGATTEEIIVQRNIFVEKLQEIDDIKLKKPSQATTSVGKEVSDTSKNSLDTIKETFNAYMIAMYTHAHLIANESNSASLKEIHEKFSQSAKEALSGYLNDINGKGGLHTTSTRQSTTSPARSQTLEASSRKPDEAESLPQKSPSQDVRTQVSQPTTSYNTFSSENSTAHFQHENKQDKSLPKDIHYARPIGSTSSVQANSLYRQRIAKFIYSAEYVVSKGVVLKHYYSEVRGKLIRFLKKPPISEAEDRQWYDYMNRHFSNDYQIAVIADSRKLGGNF